MREEGQVQRRLLIEMLAQTRRDKRIVGERDDGIAANFDVMLAMMGIS